MRHSVLSTVDKCEFRAPFGKADRSNSTDTKLLTAVNKDSNKMLLNKAQPETLMTHSQLCVTLQMIYSVLVI